GDRARRRSVRLCSAARRAVPCGGVRPVRLVWSEASARQDRRRRVLLLAVVCLFLGGILSGRPEIAHAPRPIRTVVASLLATGGLLLLVGTISLALPRRRRRGPSLALARPDPSDKPQASEPVPSLQEEEQRRRHKMS